jgi:hypothetical protein
MPDTSTTLPGNFEEAWPWMRTFRRIVRTVAEPRLTGNTVLSASDFSGSHKGSRYNVYGFVVVDAAASAGGFAQLNRVRERFLDGRRMSFKALNDVKRRNALVPFLEATELLRGVGCVVAVTKDYSHMATAPGTVAGLTGARALAGKWNAHAFETAMRAVLLWSALIGETGSGQQHVTWVVDEDEIAANDLRHTDLLELTGRLSQHLIRRQMGELCVCTTGSEGTNIGFEDFTAIADLAAGAFCESVNKWCGSDLAASQAEDVYQLSDHSGKCDLINDWYFYPSANFRRVAVLIDREARGMTIKRITLAQEPT